MILIELPVHGGDLALSEGVVEDTIDGGRIDAQARSGIAVDLDVGFQAAILLVAVDVAQAREGPQFL